MSTQHQHETRVNSTIKSAAELPDILNTAVETLRPAAAKDPRKGILVTRQRPGQFIVELTDEVPYGTTQERYAD